MKKFIFIILIVSAFSPLSFSQYKGGSYDGYYSILDTNTIVLIENNVSILENFNLYQNYPNPFNPKTIIRYDLRKTSYVTLKIYDALGKEVAELVKGKQVEGSFEAEFDATDFPSSVYFYKLTSDNISVTKKMLLTK